MGMHVVDYIEQRLHIWAEWYIRFADFGLGYPHQSLEAKMMQYGGHIIKSTGPKSMPTNMSAEEIESLVCELAKQNNKLATALRGYYFGRGTVKQRAKATNLSCTQFKVAVDMAKQWLIGRLSARY